MKVGGTTSLSKHRPKNSTRRVLSVPLFFMASWENWKMEWNDYSLQTISAMIENHLLIMTRRGNTSCSIKKNIKILEKLTDRKKEKGYALQQFSQISPEKEFCLKKPPFTQPK